jgi:O-antigen/teichoic acid export membrane protein
VRWRILSKAGALTASVIAAVIWRTYWALIAGILAERVLSTALSYIIQPYRPSFGLQAWRKVMRFSKWIAFNNILAYFNGRADIFILGRFVPTDVVGHYSVAKRISNLAASEVTMPATESLFPGFAKISQDVEKLAALYLSSLSLLLFVGLPIAVGVFLFGDLIVRVVLGEKWLPCVPLLKILSVYGIIRSSVGSTSSVMLALGKPHILTTLVAARFVVMVPLAFWGFSIAGATGVAWAVVASAGLSLALSTLVISRLLGFSTGRVVSATWRVVISTTAMAAVVVACRAFLPTAHGLWLSLSQLVVLALLGAASYLLSCAGLWALARFPEGPERHTLSLIAHGLARLSNGLRGQPSSDIG